MPATAPVSAPISAQVWPVEIPRSDFFTIEVEGTPVTVLRCAVADFAIFEGDGPVSVRLVLPEGAPEIAVKPLARGVAVMREGREAAFTLPGPGAACIEGEGMRSLFLFYHGPESGRPDPADPSVRWFGAGRIHDAGLIELADGETLYIEAGAVVRGVVGACGAKNVRVCGRGILDGSPWVASRAWRRMMHFQRCRDVRVADVTVVDTCGWTLVLDHCENVAVDRWNLIGEIIGGDGIDVVSSKTVRIRDCCIRANDDCIVVKAMRIPYLGEPTPRGPRDGAPSEDILAERCILWNDRAGNALEIGHELIADHIADVVFRDCDVLWVHGHGAAFSIANAGRATVRNVLYENIRVEHHYDFLVAFRVVESRWSHGSPRGRIENVTLRDIAVAKTEMNPGYSLSVIGGWSPQHPVEGVAFERVTYGGQPVTGVDALDLFTRHAGGIVFR